MTVKATFSADFSSFRDAVEKADVQLKSFETGAANVEKALARIGGNFDGRKIIQEAELATKAVNDLGGATKLTQNEQAKLNAQLTEAIAKYQAIGQKAPPEMQALANATAGANKATSDILGTVGKVAGAVGIGFSVGAVLNFGKSVFDSASQIHDLAEQLGISTEAVQGFKFAAEQSGSSLEAVGTAITKMNQKLSTGDDSTIAALKAAGLSFSTIRNLSPEESFLAIADAIQKVPDPMKQSELAVALFGKSAAELLPAIKEGFRGVADGASKMSDDTIKALEAAQDAWDSLGNEVVIVTGTMISATVNAMKTITGSLAGFGSFVTNSVKFGIGTATAMADLNTVAQQTPSVFKKAGDAVGDTTEEQKKAAKAANDHAQAIQNLADKFSGANSIRDANLAIEALNQNLRAGVGWWEMDAKEVAGLNKTLGDSLDAYKRFGKIAPEAIRSTFIETTQLEPAVAGLVGAFASVGVQLEKEVVPAMADFRYSLNYIAGIPFGAKIGVQVDLVPPKVKIVTATLGDLSQALSQLANVSGGTFSGMASSLATLVTSANTAKKSIDLMKSAGSEKSKLDGLLDMASGITGIVSAAIAAGKAVAALFGLFDRNKGRDLVVDFAETFGGFDALHEKLLTLGDAGEALWIKLTQGVGRNNPQQAQEAIDEVTKALEKQAEQHDDTQAATEEQAQATIETATQAAKALDELSPKIDDNEKKWIEWGDLVTAQIQRIADSLRGLTLPSFTTGAPAPAPAGAPAGGGGFAPSPIQVSVQVDGREIARSVSDFVSGERLG